MRLEGKVPSFVSGLLFLQHPAEPRHRLIHLHLLCGVSQQALQLAGLPGTLLSGLLDTSLEKTDSEHQGGASTVLLGLFQGLRTNQVFLGFSNFTLMGILGSLDLIGMVTYGGDQ